MGEGRTKGAKTADEVAHAEVDSRAGGPQVGRGHVANHDGGRRAPHLAQRKAHQQRCQRLVIVWRHQVCHQHWCCCNCCACKPKQKSLSAPAIDRDTRDCAEQVGMFRCTFGFVTSTSLHYWVYHGKLPFKTVPLLCRCICYKLQDLVGRLNEPTQNISSCQGWVRCHSCCTNRMEQQDCKDLR